MSSINQLPDKSKANIEWNTFFQIFTSIKDIKVILMVVIGKITKHICESLRKDSWFMQYENPF